MTPIAWWRKRRYIGAHRTPEELPYREEDAEDTITFFHDMKDPETPSFTTNRES